jgi:hypothetical protein
VAVDSIRGTHRQQALTQPSLFEPLLIDELLPFVRTQRTVAPTGVTLAGQSLGGPAAYAALRHPDLSSGSSRRQCRPGGAATVAAALPDSAGGDPDLSINRRRMHRVTVACH